MKKKLFTLILAIATCGMIASAATKYEINIAGTEVTSDNASRIAASSDNDIQSGYAVYNASTNTLTCYNLKILRSGQDNYGIHNRKCDNLTIVFSGSCNVSCADNALKLERSTTISAASGSNTLLYSSARIVVNLKSYSYHFTGSGKIDIDSPQEGYEAIKGDGLSSTNVYFEGAKVNVRSLKRSALSSFSAYMRAGADLTIESNGSNASVSDVYFSLAGKVEILEPYGAYVKSNSIYNSSGSQITSQDIYISDDYVALLKVNYFPDTKFINALFDYFPKGYITSSDVNNTTSLTVSGKSITDLTGINYFSILTSLDCSNNQITSLPGLPNSLKTLYCASNKFSGTLTVAGFNALTSLDVSYNTGLTTLNCYGNALTWLKYDGCSALKTLDCANNKFSSLPSLPSSVTKFNCSANQLTSMPALPSGLQELSCAVNKLTSLSVQGCNALTSLTIYGNQIKSNAMGTLVNSLRTIPVGSTGLFDVRIATNEGNEITTEQVRIARNKRWLPREYINGSWQDIPAGLVGDVNGDGKVNVTDVTTLVNMILGVIPKNLELGDINGDSKLNVTDVTALVNIILGQN